MTRRFETWPEEWGILFTLAVHSRAVYGKVRLNKALALLQRNGFPIRNKFVNAPKGPYDEKIDCQAEELEEQGLISIETEEREYENPLYIYEMTKEGRAHYKSNITPFLEQIYELPFSRSFLENFKVTKDYIRILKTSELIDMVHGELYLDDYKVFLDKIKEARFSLGKAFEAAEEDYDDSCPICLEVLGSLDFAQRALSMVEQTCDNDPYSGKNFVLYNAEKLLAIAKNLRSHSHILDPRIEKGELSMNIERIMHRLHCLEYNGELYDIIHQVKIIEDESGYLVCDL